MTAAPTRAPRSGFVSVVAWLGILSGAFGTIGSASLLLWHPGLRILVALLSSLAMLITSLGLRRRREWARQGFIVVMCYSAVLGIVGALRYRPPRLSDFTASGATLPPGVTQAQLDAMFSDARSVMLVMAAGMALIDALLVLKPRSRRVREEFDAESAA